MNSLELRETLEEGEIEEDCNENPVEFSKGEGIGLGEWPRTYVYVKEDEDLRPNNARFPQWTRRIQYFNQPINRPSKSQNHRERLRPRFIKQNRPNPQRNRRELTASQPASHDEFSYEDLLIKYKEIKSQLQELNEEEKEKNVVVGKENLKSNVPRVRKNSLRGTRSLRRSRSRSNCQSRISRSKSPQEIGNVDDDEDEQELRRIALESARGRVPTVEDSTSQSGLQGTANSVERNQNEFPRDSVDNYDHVNMELDSNSSGGDFEAEEDLDALRSNLLLSLQQAKKQCNTPLEEPSALRSPVAIIKQNGETHPIPRHLIAPPLHDPVVINLADDSSDSELERPKTPVAKIPVKRLIRVCGNKKVTQSVASFKAETLALEQELKGVRQSMKKDEQDLQALKSSVTKKRAQLFASEQKAKLLTEQLAATQRLVTANKAAVVKIETHIKIIQNRTNERRVDLQRKQILLLKRQNKFSNHQTIDQAKKVMDSSDEKVVVKARLIKLEQEIALKLKQLRQKDLNAKMKTINHSINPLIKVKEDCVRSPLNAINTKPLIETHISGTAFPKVQDLSPRPRKLAVAHNLDLFALPWPQEVVITSTVKPQNQATSVISPLEHLKAFRFYLSNGEKSISPTYANKIDPNWVLCSFDLLGTCNDDQCPWQHAKDYTMSAEETVADIIAHCPSAFGIDTKAEPKKLIKDIDVRAQHYIQLKRPFEETCSLLARMVRDAANDELMLDERPWICHKSVHRCNDSKKPRMEIECSGETEEDYEDEPLRYFNEGNDDLEILEKRAKSNPDDVDNWLQLVEVHSKKRRNLSVNCRLDQELHVLSRALEQNKQNGRLWLEYLRKYERHPDNQDLVSLCKQAFEFSPTYEIGWMLMKCIADCKPKLAVCQKLWNLVIESDGISMESRSLRALELLLFETTLRGRTCHSDGVQFLHNWLKTPRMDLLPRHVIYAWLILLDSSVHPLTYHSFTEPGDARMLDAEPILIPWKGGSSIQNHIPLLKEAIGDAKRIAADPKDALILDWNLVELHIACEQWTLAVDVCRNAIEKYPGLEEPWILLLKVMDRNPHLPGISEVISDVVFQFPNSTRLRLVVALMVLKRESASECRHHLEDLASQLCGGTQMETETCFRRLLNLTHKAHCINHERKLADDDVPYVWLCYSLFVWLDNRDVSKVMDSAIARTPNQNHLKLIWSFYLRTGSYNQWNSILKRCLISSSKSFRIDLMDSLTRQLGNDNRIRLLEAVHKWLPMDSEIFSRLLVALSSCNNDRLVAFSVMAAHHSALTIRSVLFSIACAIRSLSEDQVSGLCNYVMSVFPRNSSLKENASRALWALRVKV